MAGDAHQGHDPRRAPDPRRVLGVGPDADAAAIRRAWRRQAQVWHPDRFANAAPADRARAERRIRELNQALRQLTGTDAADLHPPRPGPRGDGPGPAAAAPRGSRRPGPGGPRLGGRVDVRLGAIPPEEPPSPGAGGTEGPGPLVFLPVGALALAGLSFLAALVLRAPSLLAVTVVAVGAAAGFFVLLPLLTMGRRRGR